MPELALHQLGREMRRRAARGDGVAQGLGLRSRDEIGNRRDAGLGVGGQDDRAADHPRNRHKVGQRIVIEPRQVDVDGDRAVREDDEGVTVRIAADQRVDADGGIGAGLVLDDDALPEAVLQVLGDDACGQVDAAAGRIGHDDADGLARECLRVRRRRNGEGGQQSDQAPPRAKPARHELSSSGLPAANDGRTAVAGASPRWPCYS